ncbi:MAG: polyphosphate polymerase domain-containing protein [Byssovorax sp.]
MADALLAFERFEYKYHVPDELSDEIRHYIRPYLVPDPYCAKSPDKMYVINNLYWDTPRLDFYYAHLNKSLDRFKLRIRTYGTGYGSPIAFLEVKRKIRQVIVKTRVGIPRDHYEAIMRGDEHPEMPGAEGNFLQDFIGRQIQYGAQPLLLIRYKREAYENVFDEDARVTFDREICYKRAEGLDLRGDQERGWTYMDGPEVMPGVRAPNLIELKFTSFVPGWMKDLVRRFGLQRVQFSKYLTAVERLLDEPVANLDDHRRSPLKV